MQLNILNKGAKMKEAIRRAIDILDVFNKRSATRNDDLCYVEEHKIKLKYDWGNNRPVYVKMGQYWYKQYNNSDFDPKRIDLAFNIWMEPVKVFLNDGIGQLQGNWEIANQDIDSCSYGIMKAFKKGNILPGEFVVYVTSVNAIVHQSRDEEEALSGANNVY